jgi:hypothetical protein
MRKLALEVGSLARTLGDWQAAHPGMALLALLPEAEAPRLPLLQQVCRDHEVPGNAVLTQLGEIGSTSAWGYPMFHNATLVCTPWHRA